MKLAFCIFKYFPYGGVARDLALIAGEALRRGHSVRAYALRWEGAPPDGVEKIEVPARGWTGPARYRRFARWVGEHLQASPVELVVGFNKMPGLDVYVAGDNCYEEKARNERGWHYRLLPRYRHFAHFERAVFDGERPVKVLTVAPAQQPVFKRYYDTPDERFFPLPPAVETSAFEASDDAEAESWLRREFDLPEDAQVLLFVGSGFVTKGLDRAIRGLAALRRAGRDVVLLVVGEDGRRPFARLAERLGVGEQVRFAGGRNEVPRLLAGADALVLPAHNEAAGMVVLEAAAAGLPVLVTDVCGFAHHVERADAGIVSPSPFDQERFNGELVELLTSPKRPAWRENGRALAASGALEGRAETACDLIERFVRGDIQPTVVLCAHRVDDRDGTSRDLQALAAACLERDWQVRVYTLSWQEPSAGEREGPAPRMREPSAGERVRPSVALEFPLRENSRAEEGEREGIVLARKGPSAPAFSGLEVVVVPVASMADHKRIERFERWVHGALRRNPAHCVVGFNKMPGLDLCVASEPCAAGEANRLRTRLYRGTPRFRQLANAEEAVFGGSTAVLAPNVAWAADHRDHYGADLEVVAPFAGARGSCGRPLSRGEVRRDWEAAPDDCVLLCEGDAGIDRVLMTLAALPEHRRAGLRLVARDAPAGARAMAAGLGLSERAHFDDDPANAGACYEAADLLVHMAYRDLGGHPVLDALSAGLPVLTLADIGHSEHVSRAGAGTVLDVPFDFEACKQALIDALEEDRRRTWGENARRYVADTPFDGVRRVVALIEEHVRRRGRALSA